MSFFTDIGIFFSRAWDFVRPMVLQFMSEAGQVLAKSALSAVTVVAQSYGSADGDVKRKAAFDLIAKDLQQQGITIGTSLIYSAIEAAVQKLKEIDE